MTHHPQSFYSSMRPQTQQHKRALQDLKCHPFPLVVPEDATTQHAPQIVIAHRGASAHLPEHSLAGYRLALELGADYIEPDLVATSDQQLIAIHSMDLSVTTNVEEVFGAERKTASKFKGGEMGYWTYDFTLAEIEQLTLKQRLPTARSKVFDGLFKIPTLSDILSLLIEWNDDIQPHLYNLNATATKLSMNKLDYPPPPRGMYAELKDSPWLLEDTGMNLLELFYKHMQQNQDLWQKAMFQHMCDTKLIKQHEYKLPLLMLQAFQADVLQDFTKQWEVLSKNDPSGDDVSLTAAVPDPNDPSSSTLTLPLPVPPTILLVSHDKCHSEEFWFEIEDKYREYVSGVGIDKRCFFSKDDEDGSLIYSPFIMEKARKAGWVVHPWTERPEVEFFVQTDLSRRRRRSRLLQGNATNATDAPDNSTSTFPPTLPDNSTATLPPTVPLPPTHMDPPPGLSSSVPLSSPFTTVMEELMFFKCKIGVQGIFSESVDTAVRAFNMPCPGDEGSSGGSSVPTTPAECPTTNNSPGLIDTNNVPLGPLILASFCFGILATLVTWKLTGGRRGRQVLSTTGGDDENGHHNGDSGIMMTNTRFGRNKQHAAVATDDSNELTLTAEDREML